jgi:hypothetical protein
VFGLILEFQNERVTEHGLRRLTWLPPKSVGPGESNVEDGNTR